MIYIHLYNFIKVSLDNGAVLDLILGPSSENMNSFYLLAGVLVNHHVLEYFFRDRKKCFME